MTPLAIRLLGSPEADFGDGPLTFKTRKVLALLVYLGVERRMHSRESLMALLWPESPSSSAAASLRVTLSRLRRSLAQAGTDALVTEGGFAGLDAGFPVYLDLDWLAAAAQPETSLDDLTPILELDRGEFLEGFTLPDAPEFDNWAAVQREACQRQVETVYDRLSQHLLATHKSAVAVETAARWVARATLSEQAYRRLMAAQALNGQRSAALQAYQKLQNVLKQELGLEPVRETVVLADNIRQGYVGTDRPGPPSPAGSLTGSTRRRLPLIGRSEEHSRLVDVFRRTGQAGTRVVFLIGAAGTGKTRLVSAFQEWARLDAPETEFWQGRAFETGGRLAYQPVIAAFRSRLEGLNAPEDLLDDVWLAELSQLMPELRVRYPDLPPPLTGSVHFVRARIFEAMAKLGSALAGRRPAVLMLDDIQWADAGTFDLVQYLARRWTELGVPILLLMVIRQEAYAADAMLREWVTNLGRDTTATRLLLDRLNGAAVGQLVARLAGETASERTVSDFAAWLWAETRGLPFFIEALLQMLVEQSVIPVTRAAEPVYDFAAALDHVRSVAQVPMPPGVREVIRARLEQQSMAARSLLMAAAVLGRDSRFERLSQVADLPEPEALEALEALVNGGLLNERPSDQRPYSLAHDYIREVVYGENREARRRVFHRRALLALENDGAPAAECAYHALASLLDEPALRYSLTAGDQALAKFALEECLGHYEQARGAHRRMAAGEIAADTLLRLYQNRGRAFELGQQDRAAQDNYQELLDLAEARNDQQLKLTALTSLGILYATGITVFNLAQAGELGQAALELARLLADRAGEARALWCMMLVEHFSGGEAQRIMAYGSEALAIARESGLKELEGYVQTNLAWAYFNNEQFEEARAANDGARIIWQTLGNLPMVADSYTIKLHMYRNTGDFDALLALEQEALGVSRAIKNVLHEGLALYNICDAYCSQGQFNRAMAALEAARNLAAAASEIPNADIGVFLYSIHIFLSAGELEKAGLWADRLYALKETYQPVVRTFFLAAVARARIEQERFQEAEDILNSDLDVLDQDRPALIYMAPVFVADAHLQLALGHPERAMERAASVIQRLHQTGSRNCLAEAYWLLGRAWLTMGAELQAREALQEALAAARVTSERPILWQILSTLSDLERASGNPGEADRLRDQARGVVLEIAAHAGELEDVFIAQPGVSELLAGTGKWRPE